ncbi:N-acetylneuraminate synthase [Candidatus Heimdallarchaeota archaeon B3_Heim]|nr:MAG: N-acetylneuraminate synthase [Candidatus Heimdallarchaeota archaeon B3_Heim]
MGGDRTFIIAEGGVNHNGNIDIAKDLIDEAVKSKVDAIKFQTFVTEELVTSYAPKAKYQEINTAKNESQYEMIKKLELSFESFQELKSYADNKGILFFSTPFDLKSAEFLSKISLPAFKVGSGDMNNVLLLERIAFEKKPILLSTGMATLEEITEIFEFLKQERVIKLLLFHCITSYPASVSKLNLNIISTLKNLFNVPIGYSDHSIGIEIPQLAVAAGAKAIEKHFTLDKNLPGPDHKASLEPEELKEMVNRIRFTEKVLGSSTKQIDEVEKQNRVVARKSIVAMRNIPKGAILSKEDLGVKRPGNGLPPVKILHLIGKETKVSIDKDVQLRLDMLH